MRTLLMAGLALVLSQAPAWSATFFKDDFFISGGTAGVLPELSLAIDSVAADGPTLIDPLVVPLVPGSGGGTTIRFDSGAAFDRIAAGLTDGIAGRFSVLAVLGNAAGTQTRGFAGGEENAFGALPASYNGIDFEGSTVEAIIVTLRTVSLSSPGRDPNRNGDWTDFTVYADVEIEGTIGPSPVPLPLPVSMLAAGCVLIGWLSARSGTRPGPSA